ncbi:MAG: DUF423 domain-containing protein [Deinococcota bacterium]|jgi:uncharacterized membrane protein YgdD (TMEM256/DUF423 family)|nr:DUF423 domain-containing protein [Deinococcota bacterium]
MKARRAVQNDAAQKNDGRGRFSLDPLKAGAVLGLVAVALGAFGAHLLEGLVAPGRLGTFETAVRYQMYHALALLLLGALPPRTHRAAPFFLYGSIIFSGSLYLLVLTGTGWLGAITPLGGLLQLAGWAVLFFTAPAKVR